MKTFKILLAFGLLSVWAACGDDTPTNIADGWAAFQAGNYEEAYAFFRAGIADDPVEARIGLGWTTMKMDSLVAADGYFTGVAGDSAIHGYAGWAIVSWVRGNYLPTISRADFVLRKAPAFVFEYDIKIGINMMILSQAYSYYHLGNFSSCLNKIKVLDPAYPNTTDPAALLTKLDALSAAP